MVLLMNIYLMKIVIMGQPRLFLIRKTRFNILIPSIFIKYIIQLIPKIFRLLVP